MSNDNAQLQELEAVIEADHHSLAQLMSEMGGTCTQADADEHQCRRCPSELVQACETVLENCCRKVRGHLLDHFAREDALMHRLPPGNAFQLHCTQHQKAHGEFSTRYNRLVATPGNTAVWSRITLLNDVLHDWARKHALEYDHELARLLHTRQ